MFVKITGNDGSIIAVERHDTPVYICYQTINRIAVRCSKQKAQGLLSEDSSQIYQFKNKEAMPGNYLLCEEITEAEYEQLAPELEITEPDEDPEGGESENPGTDGVMSVAEMRAKIIELTEQVEFLGDCLVEMSEVVYE